MGRPAPLCPRVKSVVALFYHSTGRSETSTRVCRRFGTIYKRKLGKCALIIFINCKLYATQERTETGHFAWASFHLSTMRSRTHCRGTRSQVSCIHSQIRDMLCGCDTHAWSRTRGRVPSAHAMFNPNRPCNQVAWLHYGDHGRLLGGLLACALLTRHCLLMLPSENKFLH